MTKGLTCVRRLPPELQRLRERVLAKPPPARSSVEVDEELRELEAEKAKLLRVLALRDEVAKLRMQVGAGHVSAMVALLDLVAARTGVTVAKILGRTRPEPVTWARHVVCHLARELTELTLEEIGTALDRDHGTVMHSLAAVSARCETDATAAAMVKELEAAGRRALEKHNSEVSGTGSLD